MTEVEGITVADQQIPESFSSSHRCYGGTQLSSEEKVLSLPPKFSVYQRVEITACEAQIEKGLTKFHWTAQKTGDTPTEPNGPNGTNHEPTMRLWTFDAETKTVDLRHL